MKKRTMFYKKGFFDAFKDFTSKNSLDASPQISTSYTLRHGKKILELNWLYIPAPTPRSAVYMPEGRESRGIQIHPGSKLNLALI